MPLDSTTAAGTIAGKQFWDEDVDEDWRNDGKSTATRTITCRWPDRIAIVGALLGGSTQSGVVTNASPAAQYPDAPHLIVSGIRPEGVGVRNEGPNGMVGYDFARLRITYAETEKDLGQTVDLGSLSLDISSEILSPPRDRPTFKWKGDGTDVTPEATPGLPVSTARFERVRRNLASLPIPLILSLLDNVNDAVFEGAAAGRVLYQGCRPFRKVTNLGVQNWDVSHVFTYRRVEWNKFLRPTSGQFEEVVYKGSNQPHFPSANLSLLYQ